MKSSLNPSLIIIYSLLTFLPAPSSGANLTWAYSGDFNFANQATAGFERQNNYYIGRVRYREGVVLGHFSPNHNAIFFGYKGKELSFTKGMAVQVLKYHRGLVTWIRRESGEDYLPYNIVLGGISPQGSEHLYVCRAFHEDSLVPGQLSLEEDMCSISYAGKEFKKGSYEVLVLSLYGIIRRATV